MTDITLVVLQHGLWGESCHMSYLEQALNDKVKDDATVVIFNAKANEGKYTYDGIDVCGQRLANEIQSYVKELAMDKKWVKKLSIVGYSLGGLITRYAIGILDQEGFFNNDIKPGFYVTFATPHMGVFRPKTVLFSGIFNFVIGYMVSRTGEQIQLRDTFADGVPLLVILASPDQPYYQALKKFDTLRNYVNIKNDRSVPYWTAALETVEYFSDLESLDLAIDEDYPSIVTGCDIWDKSKKPKTIRHVPLTSKLRKALFYVTLTILFPFIFVAAFIYVGTQGLISRRRVAKILMTTLPSSTSTYGSTSSNTTKSELIPNKDRHEKDASAELLSGALDAVNISIDNKNPAEHKATNTQGHWCNVVIPDALKERSVRYTFAPTVIEIRNNLAQLPWQNVLVCLHAFNSHAAIVCRQGMHTTNGGKVVVKHFLDTVSLGNSSSTQ